jgi:hypothetical protein
VRAFNLLDSLVPRAIALLTLLGGPSQAPAQGTDASLSGRVVTDSFRAIPRASVSIRNASTGFIVNARSDAKGRFSFRQLPLGTYELTVRAIGFSPAVRFGLTVALGDKRELIIDLASTARPLEAVQSVGQQISGKSGSGYTLLDQAAIASLPAIGRNFTDLVGLTPLAGAELSIAGARTTSTDIRMDGLQARNMLRGGELGRGPYTVSLEAIREFRVITNVYDVTVGRQGGGTVGVATRSGTNELSASGFSYFRNDALSASRDFLGRDREARRQRAIQYGGSASGPIIRDRLHYFVAFDRQDLSEPLPIGDIRSSADEIDLQIAKDSLTRLIQVLENKYALGSAPQLGVFGRKATTYTAFARLDWQMVANHLLSIRHNVSHAFQPENGFGDQRISLLESRSSTRATDHQLLAVLRSTIGDRVENEARVGLALADRTLRPNTLVPRGFVRIRSTLPDGTTGDARVQFGGNRLAPEESGEREYQLANNLYIRAGSHAFTIGTDNTVTRLRTFIPTDEGGLFEFDDLASLDALRSARYSRQVPLGAPPRATQTVMELSLYGQDEWRLSPNLSALLGVRQDVTSFRTAAIFNPLIEERFGVRTDERPTDWRNIQPRAQITWSGAGERHSIRLGGGAFASQPHYYLHANDIFFNGTQLADLTLTGTAVPTPDFAAYRADLSAVPGVPAGLEPPAYVNLISSDFRTPTTWKASLSYTVRPTSALQLTGTLLGARTVHNYQYFDRNLVEAPAFTLDNEQGRSVFVPASTIPANGRTTARFAYRHPEFTHVLELVSTGKATQKAVVLEAEWSAGSRMSAWGSYTLNSMRDNSTFNCCIARTASLLTPIKSDPRDISESSGPSDFDFRHKMAIAVALPPLFGARASARYTGMSGRPFSLVVNGDINGDDYNGNDLAFVFDPADPSTPPEIAASMRRVLANPDNVARDYIRENLGRIAERNGGRAPFTQRIDVRFARTFSTRSTGDVELTIDVFNFANLLNRRWGGQFLLPPGLSPSNPISQQLSLLNVVGFDQQTRTYRYTVNEGVGVLRKRGEPYQVQLGARVTR